MDNTTKWFKGFEKGIATLSQAQRETFFCECGKHCVENGVLPIYKQLYEEVKGDMDAFFIRANEFDGVKGEIVCSHKSYNLCFSECTCHLHSNGYVNTPLLCECSRQSVLYAMHTLWKKRQFDVTLVGSILRGDKECKLNIKVIE